MAKEQSKAAKMREAKAGHKVNEKLDKTRDDRKGPVKARKGKK